MTAGSRTAVLATAIRSRAREWALRRQGRDVLPVRLASRRVYILPTAAGWTFAMLLAVMFVAGMNYGNGLALLFTFWLTGFALVAMVQTQRALAGTVVHAATAQPAHAGDAVRLQISVTAKHAPADLQLCVDGLPTIVSGLQDAAQDDPARGTLGLDIPVSRRGRWRAPALRMFTTAPFGLFRTWTWLDPGVTTVVYPAPGGLRQVPEIPGASTGGLRHVQGHDELAWLREFREGDSPRQVAWKAYARGQPLLVREYHGEGALRQEFDFDALSGLGTEERLSQLTRWILDADQQGVGWTLRLPGAMPLEGAGAEHRRLCLTHLALHGSGEKP